MTNLFEDLVISKVSVEDTLKAAENIKGTAVRTPLVKFNWRRPDLPDLEIYLKLETLQPINSFKIRGAVNKVKSIDAAKLKSELSNTIVSASAGNMGQGVACAAKELGFECVVVVPDHAPQTKLQAMEDLGARIIKVPFARWWEVLMTGDAMAEVGKPHAFVHPVCDPLVVAGNSTVGLEILEDLPDVDAVFCAFGGGGCCGGVGSAMKNAKELLATLSSDGAGPSASKRAKTTATNGKTIDMVSVEPATAAPMCLSFNNNKTITPLTDHKASWVDGCGGKSVLKPMWPLAKEVLTHAMKVELEAIERALKMLVEKNRVVAEGAGACPVAAAMFAPYEQMKNYTKVVAIVCGGCIDTTVLTRILAKDFSIPYQLPAALGRPSSNGVAPHLPRAPTAKVISAAEVRKTLPMSECIDATQAALTAFANGEGFMPLRQVTKLPFKEPQASKIGFIGNMPSFCGDYAASKSISVFPANSATNGRFSSHQGAVMLWNAAGNGELLLMADAHEITKIRTAAASAVATRLMLDLHRRRDVAKVLGIVGTGDQARSHVEAMLAVMPSLNAIRLCGRNLDKAKSLCSELLQHEEVKKRCVSVTAYETVEACVLQADVICTVTSAREAILFDKHIKDGCHINAVGACTPQFRELEPAIFENVGFVVTDSIDGCIKEPGDVLDYLKKKTEEGGEAKLGSAKKRFIAIGDVLPETAEARNTVREAKNESGTAPRYTLFRSLGIALEDLFSAKVIHEKTR